MKALAVSVLANLVLLVALALRPSLAPPTVRDFLVKHFHLEHASAAEKTSDVASAKTAKARSLPSIDAVHAPLLGIAFATDNFAVMTARMRAAGFPAGVIAEIARREIDARYDARMNALTQVSPNTPFWKTSPDAIAAAARLNSQLSQLMQEREKAYRDAVNDPFFFKDSALDIGQRRMWGDLPRNKLDRIQRIEDDYADMISTARTAASGVVLAEDRAKLELLEREKQTDIAALLSPEELAEYKLRTGSTGVASRLRLFNPTEAEYRVIAQAQIDASARLNSSTVTLEQRRATMQAFEAQMKASMSSDRYADFLLTTNPEFQYLTQVAESDRLPSTTTRQVFAVRDQVAQESNRIFDDPALDPSQKRAALQTLAQNARNQLTSILGPTSRPAYMQMADGWLKVVASGSALSFTMNNPLGGSTPTFRRLPGLAAPGSLIIRSQ